MPTYQYTCTECSHAFEQFQSFSDDALSECPECGGRLRKVFNAVGVVFKGSGFYRTDSRAGGSSTVPAGSGADGGSSSAEGKPAAAPAKAPVPAASSSSSSKSSGSSSSGSSSSSSSSSGSSSD